MPGEVRIKRAYEEPSKSDGYRVLVERLWPRGVRKDALALDEWCRDVAPTTELRKWFGHDTDRWEEFVRRYEAQLGVEPAAAVVGRLIDRAGRTRMTLVYAARDTEHNSAVVLKQVMDRDHG